MFGGTVVAGAGVAGGGGAAGASGVAVGRPQEQPYPYIRIVEQPASKALRFRYECEGRSAGSIPGVNSTAENKTYPTIEIVGYRGRAIVVVSCVTKDSPYRPHPHNLVGKDLCKRGICTVEVSPDSMAVSFSNLGIQCVKKRDIESALRVREELRVDPFKTGFAHKSQPSSIDLNAVRLAFQAFIEKDGKIKAQLAPVVSDVIYDKKAMSELTICKLSHCATSAGGGDDVILLCEKVTKEDITVTFFEKCSERIVWQADADSVNVHKQVAIYFRTPRYQDPHVQHNVQAYIQLRRPSDGATSEPIKFEIYPMKTATALNNKKRKMLDERLTQYQPPQQEYANQNVSYLYDVMSMSEHKPIKLEPREQGSPGYGQNSPTNFGMYRNIAHSPSPQHPSPPHPSPPHPSPPHLPHYARLDLPAYGAAWNIAPEYAAGYAPHAAPAASASWLPDAPPAAPPDAAICSLLNMDTSLVQLNSAELSGLSGFLDSVTRPAAMDQDNMTDSFTKLTTNP